MTPDEIRYRHCSTPGCPYKEFRGSRVGQFIDGKFVCPLCYLAWLIEAGLLGRNDARKSVATD